MAGKGFGLEQVLTYRKEVERVRTVEYASAREAFEGARARLCRDEERTEYLSLELLDRQQEGMPAVELQLYADFLQHKNRDLQMQRQELNTLNVRLSDKQSCLVEAVREKKVLETLKKKKNRALEREMNDKERRFIEEIVLLTRGR